MLPLADVRVLDFTQTVAGPTCTTLLADYGADVITIEPPTGASQRHFSRNSLFPNLGRNKRSVVIDLKSDSSGEIIERLVETVDVVVHSFKPGTMKRLGCDYETLREHNEDLVYCSLTGYGESGPYRDRPAYDPLAQAMSGLMHMTGEPDRKPSRVGGSVVDVSTGITAAFAVMLGLWRRETTGEVGKVEASLLDTAATIMGYWYTYSDLYGSVPERRGSHYPPYSPYGLLQTSDGFVYITTPKPEQWERLCVAVGREDWIDDPRFATNDDRVANRDALVDALEGEFEDHIKEEVVDVLLAENVPAAELQTVGEAARDDHLRDRGTVTDIETTDGERVAALGRGIHFPGEDVDGFTDPPSLGQHTEEVLAEVGFTEEEVSKLAEDGDLA